MHWLRRGVAGPASEAPLEREAEDPANVTSDCHASLAMTMLGRGCSEGEASPFR